MVKKSAHNTRDMGLTPGSGKFPEEGSGNPLQHSCLGNSMDKEPGGLQFIGSQRSQTVHGILQARILVRVAFPFSRGSSQPKDRTPVSHIPGRFLTS